MQNALTMIVSIKRAELAALSRYLHEIGEHINTNPYIDFKKAITTHFCRWVILDETTETPHLLFNANFDGPVEVYIYGLVDWLGDAMDQIWGRCEGYPTGRTTNPAYFRQKFCDYVKNHSHRNPVFFRAYFNRSVQEVLAACKLRNSLRDLLNVQQAEAFAYELSQIPIVRKVERLNGGRIVGGLIGLVFAPLGFALTRLSGSKPKFDPNDPGPVVNIPLEVTERQILQNELTIIAPIKPMRLLWLRIVLNVAGPLTKPPFTADGKLSDMSTIHFARWAIIDGLDGRGKRLLFESNYDGSWEKYIDDFIDHAWQGLDLIFGNCVGYPKGGSRNSEYFKEAIIDHQKRADVFYSAYPAMSVRNIVNNLAIRDQLGRFLGDKIVTDWLRRL